MDALETARVEPLLKVLHRLAQDQGVVARLDAHVIAGDVDQSLDHGEAVEARHLDIEENEVRLVGLDLADRLAPIGRGADDFDIVERLKPQLQALGSQGLVVDQNGPDGHETVSPVSKGISMITLKPPRSFFLVSKRCAPP